MAGIPTFQNATTLKIGHYFMALNFNEWYRNKDSADARKI